MKKATANPPFSAKSKNIPPVKKKREERNYLTPSEIDKIISATKKDGRYGLRNSALILLIFRHGFRSIEISRLRWSDIDFRDSTINIRRVKGSKGGIHPIRSKELRLLRSLENVRETEYVFESERKTNLSTRSIRNIVSKAGKLAKLEIDISPHHLRHSCGYYLANNNIDTRGIQDYLGHRNIKNTVLYTESSPDRFKDFWDD